MTCGVAVAVAATRELSAESAELIAFGRVLWRGAGITQQALADRAEPSRPQLANAMQGRFGLSPAAGFLSGVNEVIE